jgi:hypothetical protein
VEYNREDSFAVWDTMEVKFLCCGIQQKKSSQSVYRNRGKLFCCIPQGNEISSIVGYKGEKPPPLYPTMQEMLLRCITQLQKNNFNNSAKINFSADGVFTNENGS